MRSYFHLLFSFLAPISYHVEAYRFIAQPDDVRDGASSTVFHDNPQVSVLKVTAIVLHNIGTGPPQHKKIYRCYLSVCQQCLVYIGIRLGLICVGGVVVPY